MIPDWKSKTNVHCNARGWQCKSNKECITWNKLMLWPRVLKRFQTSKNRRFKRIKKQYISLLLDITGTIGLNLLMLKQEYLWHTRTIFHPLTKPILTFCQLTLETVFCELIIQIQTSSLKKKTLRKIATANSLPICLGLIVLTVYL